MDKPKEKKSGPGKGTVVNHGRYGKGKIISDEITPPASGSRTENYFLAEFNRGEGSDARTFNVKIPVSQVK